MFLWELTVVLPYTPMPLRLVRDAWLVDRNSNPLKRPLTEHPTAHQSLADIRGENMWWSVAPSENAEITADGDTCMSMNIAS